MKPKSWMHTVVMSAVVLAAAAGGAWVHALADSPKRPSFRRVESITLDPSDCKLSWTVSRGEVQNGEFAPKGKREDYEISFHHAEMRHDGVTLQFSEEEAVRVHQVILAITRYTADSVDWFEQQEKPVQRAAR